MKTKYYAIDSELVENCTFNEIMEFNTEQERDEWANAAKGREALADMDFLGLDTRTERAARMALARQGYQLKKNTKNLEINPYHSGCYRIVDSNNIIIAGESFDMTLQDVWNFINE